MNKRTSLKLSLFVVATICLSLPVAAQTDSQGGDEPSASEQAEESQGMSAFPTGALQYLTGCGVGIASIPCNLVSCGAWGCLVQPAVLGGVEAWLGDSIGDSRSPMIWPILTAYGVGVAGLAVSIGLDLFFSAAFNFAVDPKNPLAAMSSPLYWARAGIGLGSFLVLSAAVPLVYHLASVPKKPGDTGEGFPGFLEPADPTSEGDADQMQQSDNASDDTSPDASANESSASTNDDSSNEPPADDSSSDIKPFDY